MKKVIQIALLFFFCYIPYADAQIIKNELNIYMGAQVNYMKGDEILNENGFITPSLYSNMGNSYSVNSRAIYRYKPYFSVGGGIDAMYSENWACSSFTNYVNSNTVSVSLCPMVQFHTARKDSGFFNQFKLYVQCSPVLGFSSLNMNDGIDQIKQNNGNSFSGTSNSFNLNYGAEASLGIEYTVSSDIGFYLAYGYRRCWVESELYNDKKYSNSFIQFGIYFRLMKDKYYKYL